MFSSNEKTLFGHTEQNIWIKRLKRLTKLQNTAAPLKCTKLPSISALSYTVSVSYSILRTFLENETRQKVCLSTATLLIGKDSSKRVGRTLNTGSYRLIFWNHFGISSWCWTVGVVAPHWTEKFPWGPIYSPRFFTDRRIHSRSMIIIKSTG